MKPLVFVFVWFAAMAVGFVSAQKESTDETKARLKTENETLQAENGVLLQQLDRLKVVLGLNAEDIETWYEEALALHNDGNATKVDRIAAYDKMNLAYAAFERLSVKSVAARVRYLQLLFDLADALQENEKTIEHAIDLALHAREDNNKAFAYNALWRTYGASSESATAIFYFQKALAIYAKDTQSDHARISEANWYLGMGKIYGQQRNVPMARENLVRAKNIFTAIINAADPRVKEAEELLNQLNPAPIAPPVPRPRPQP